MTKGPLSRFKVIDLTQPLGPGNQLTVEVGPKQVQMQGTRQLIM